jgi:hypothetical protein
MFLGAVWVLVGLHAQWLVLKTAVTGFERRAVACPIASNSLAAKFWGAGIECLGASSPQMLPREASPVPLYSNN